MTALSRILFLVLFWNLVAVAQPSLPGDPAATPLPGLEMAALASFVGTYFLIRNRGGKK